MHKSEKINNYPKTIVFVETTLCKSYIENIPNLTCSSAIKRGDIYGLSEEFTRIIIVDGLFGNTRSVWQREITYALSIGIEVYGTSSMGALRAAELSGYGMKGYGWVFNCLCQGLLEGDDEVALIYSRHKEGRIIHHTITFCNLYWNLLELLSANIITLEEVRNILGAMREIPFFKRSIEETKKILSAQLSISASDELISRLKHIQYDIKAIDFLGLLNILYPIHQMPLKREERQICTI